MVVTSDVCETQSLSRKRETQPQNGLKAARGAYPGAGHPAGFVGGQEYSDPGDILRLAKPAERGLRHQSLLKVAADQSNPRVPSVSTGPGATAFTRIFRPPNSIASTVVMVFKAAFVAA